LDTKESYECCGHLVYTPLTDPSRLIDPTRWDGSDMFMVWPLPKFIFVTERVARFVEQHELTGARLEPVPEMRLQGGGFTPGRLSYYVPRERAQKLGRELGIV
jgi:hypothetical protein